MDVMFEREGGDITAADMITPETPPSEIVKFFTGSTIFITGATGFLGKLFMEKLLRQCPDLERIYVLVRPKKGKEVKTRFDEIFEGPEFGVLKRKNPGFASKVELMQGDCALPDLGLSTADKETLIAETNCVIHCAATVRFDEKLRNAVNINVRAVTDLLAMAKQMKNLRVMLHISTAFSNCTRKQIEEKFYEPPITGPKVLSLLEALDDNRLDQITPFILGDYPNTYVFTKAVAEDVIRTQGKNLPIGVVRPSIVIATVKEPVSGFIDNVYGATGVLVGAALGVLRCLQGKRENTAEMVPADYVISSSLAAAWDIATLKSINDNTEETSSKGDEENEIPVYNYVSSVEKKLTWDQFAVLAEKHCMEVPSPLLVWHYFFFIQSTRAAHQIAMFFLHTIPAYLVDFLAICIGRKPMLVEGYRKINKFGEVIAYFSMRQWAFTNHNVQQLWQKLNACDQELFEFSMKNFNWDAYFYTYVRGARLYLLKDPIETVPEGQKKYTRLMVAHYALLTVLALLAYKLIMMVLGVVFF